MTWNKNMDDAPRDGTPIVVWMQRKDMSRYSHTVFFHKVYGWCDYDSFGDMVDDPNEFKGWMLYPQPPEVEG